MDEAEWYVINLRNIFKNESTFFEMESLLLFSFPRLFILLLGFCFPFSSFTQPVVTDLKVNYQTTPLGIDTEKPLFSWRMEAEGSERGQFQQAYQIQVVDESDREVWNTGRMDTAVSVGIRYAGTELTATTRYSWTVTVWDQDGEATSASSWFETGLMNPDPRLSAWDGATWIGGSDEDMVLQSHYLSVFRLEYTLQLDEESQTTKAAFLFGANDQRLMDPNLNLNGMRVGPDESYIALELDVTNLEADKGQAKLNIYRVGFAPEDQSEVPFKTFEISKSLLHQSNVYQPHRFFLESVFGVIDIYLDELSPGNKITQVQQEGGFGRAGVNLNPYGRGQDFICFPLLGDIGFQMSSGQKARFSEVRIRHYRQPSNVIFSEDLSRPASFGGIFSEKVSVTDETYAISGGKTGQLILANPSRNAAPMLRTEFRLEDKPIRKARLYATARGIYELYLNGQRIGEDYFNPGLTHYNKTHLYQTYDVTEQLEQGAHNALGAWMSEGWWSGNVTFSGQNWNFFGDRQSLLAKLVITYEDGTENVVTSDPSNWKLFTEGPIRYGSFFQGELYDARKERAIEGWSSAKFDDSEWKPAVTVPLEGTSVTGTYASHMGGRIVNLKYDEQQILGQIGQLVSHVETLTAKSREEVRPGVFVYDMGQNMVGVPRLTITNGQAGDTVRIRYAEVRYPDLPEYGDQVGMIMIENIRGALTQDLYILKGGDEIIEPRFTFHGYRFMEITGLEEPLPAEAVQGKVLSSVSGLASSYETSNALVNRLWKNITWSLRGNFLSIPTDTPARNERMGWNGDINVFARAATWLADANQFLKRHLRAMRDMQAENGRFSDVAPIGNGFGGTLWGSAGIVIPWEVYQQYGDKSLLEEHYPAMKKYVAFLASRQNEDGVLVEGPLGDWLSPENSRNDNTLLWTAYQVYNLDILQKVATILGKEKDAESFRKQYEDRKAFFNRLYVSEETHKTVMSGTAVGGFGPPPENPPKKGDLMDTQASYAIPLALDVFTEEHREAAVDHLAASITRKNVDDLGVERPPYSLMTGFIGTASIGEALSENGLDGIAYRLLQTESYPSWLYPVVNGATTIWERLNSYTIEDGFGGNNSMNSFNHYAFGAIAAWMYNYSLGIQRSPGHPALKQFILEPTPDPTGKMTYAQGHYDSMYGRIVSEWHKEGSGTRFRFIVPANTRATLFLQAGDIDRITEGGDPVEGRPGMVFQGKQGEKMLFEISSGEYEFFVEE